MSRELEHENDASPHSGPGVLGADPGLCALSQPRRAARAWLPLQVRAEGGEVLDAPQPQRNWKKGSSQPGL